MFLRQVALVLAALAFSASYAQSTADHTALLSSGDVQQLATDLGEGPIHLTRIFSHVAGDGLNSHDFHTAADNVGRTFSVLHVVSAAGDPIDQLIGGYDPRSWRPSGQWNFADPSDRTSFLFNLTTDVFQQERADAPGTYQAFNDLSFGPTFGAGFDLYCATDLDHGDCFSYSYGDQGGRYGAILPTTNSGYTLLYGGLEVFTISAQPAPEPDVWAGLAVGIAALIRRRGRLRSGGVR